MTRPDPTDAAVKDRVRRHWNGRAATFDDASQHGIHTDEQRERWLETLREWAGDGPRRTLDVGCGTGVVSLLLAELGHAVTGVDVAPAMLQRARKKARQADRSVAFHRGDAESLPVPDDTYDLLTARHLLWTLPNPERAIGEWQRVVGPGGRVLLIEGRWNHSEPWDEYEEVHDELPMYHGRSPADLRGILEAKGLRDVESEPLLDPVLWGRDPHHEYYLAVGTVPR